jgi:hypothetical protein
MIDRYDGTVTMPVNNPALAAAAGTVRFAIDWPEVSIAVESRLDVRSDAHAYHVTIELDATEGDESFAKRRWSQRIPRHLA